MADSLFNILSGRNYDEPPEVASIKKFVHDTLHADVSVTLKPGDIVIGAGSASLANALRLKLPELKRRCQIEKKIIVRIT